MLSPTLVVARKEAIDSLRDTRSVISSLMYALMGPAVIFMVSMAVHVDAVLIGMMSVFTLVAAFVGGMNVAMDTVAGERERRSLLPLLMNPVRRREIVLGKWLAVGLFSFAGLILNLAGFAIVFASAGMAPACVRAASFAGRDGRYLAAGAAGGLAPTADLHGLPRREGSPDLPLDAGLPAHGPRHVSGVLPGGGARVVRLPASHGAATATRTLDEGWACPIRSGGRAGLLHRRTGPAGIGGCRKQATP